MYVNFVGRIGRVHVQTTARGTMVDLSVAVDSRYVDRQNNNQHDTYWLNLSAYGDLAASMLTLISPEDGGTKNPVQTGGLVKGALIEGSAVFNRERTYTGKDGITHTSQDFLLTNWGFVRIGTGQGQRQGQPQRQPQQPAAPQQTMPQTAPQPQQPVQQTTQQPQPGYSYPQPTPPVNYGYTAIPAPAGYAPTAQPAPDVANPFAALGM